MVSGEDALITADADARPGELQRLVGLPAILAAPIAEPLEAMITYYASLASPDRLPQRHDFKPASLGGLLSQSFLVRVDRSDPHVRRYQYLVFGSQLAGLFGVDMTGKWLDDYAGPNRVKRAWDLLEAVIEGRESIWHQTTAKTKGNKLAIGESVVMPLADGDDISHIFGALEIIGHAIPRL